MESMRGSTVQDRHQTIRLLDYDPELGRSLRPERRAEARRSARATSFVVERGNWSARELADERAPAYGLLLLDGLASRTVLLDDVEAAQLVGRGDLLPPSDEHGGALVATAVRWTVIEPLIVARLDERFLLTVRRWPELVAALFEKIAAQADRRGAHRALCQLPRVEDRLHAVLWLLAERWGVVTPEGVVLRLPLTHELLGQLVGARRPTVSLAVKQLEEEGFVHRCADGGWLLVRADDGPAAQALRETPRLRPLTARGSIAHASPPAVPSR